MKKQCMQLEMGNKPNKSNEEHEKHTEKIDGTKVFTPFSLHPHRPTHTHLRVAEADADRIVNAQNVGHTRPRVRIVDQLQRRRHTVGRDVLLRVNTWG